MKDLFIRLYQKFEEKPTFLKLLLFSLIGLFSGALFLAHFSEDISSFLPENEQNKRINEAYQHLNTTNKIVVFLSAKDTTKDVRDNLIAVAEEFVDLLKKNDTDKLTNNIFYKVTDSNISEISDFIVDNVHLFMKEKDYMRIDSLLIDENKMFSELVWTQQLLNSPSNVMLQNMLVNDPIHISNTILKRLNDCQQENSFSHYNGYVFDSKGKEILITLSSETPASETQKNKQWLKTIQKTSASIEDNHKGEIQITHIGASNISIGNAEQIKKDSIITSVVALLLIAALLFFYFRDLRAIGLILASILFGALAALALLALFKNEISIIAVGVGSIIVGIAANYPLHFLSHLQENKSAPKTLKDLSMPLIVGNITTVGAFLSLLFINSTAMKDMGLFSALLLVGTIAFVLIFLPHFCKKIFNRQSEGKIREIPFFSNIAKFAPEENKYIVLSVLILTIPLLYFSTKTEFETDLHKINYMTDNQRSLMQKLIQETGDTLQKTYCVCEGATKEEALLHYERLTPLFDSLCDHNIAKKIHGISLFAPSITQQKQAIIKWNDFWDVSKEMMQEELEYSGKDLGLPNELFVPFINKISRPIPTDSLPDFSILEKNISGNYIYESPEKTLVYTIIKSTKENAPIIQARLNEQGKNVFAFDDKALFTKMVETLSFDFNNVLFFCAFIVFLFLWISFGRLEISMIAFVPLTVSWFWILGIMELTDIHFNIVNIILATFIFGQGDDYTIFVTEGLMYEYAHNKKRLDSYKKSVALSACIMFIGIGVLIFAQHPALRSLAQVTIIGMFTVILMSFLFPPLLFKWLTRSKGELRLMPITLRNLINTVLSFSVFLFFSIIYSIGGFLLLVIGGKSEANKLRFHKMICWIFKKFAQWIPNVEHHVSNLSDYNFEKPSILICNHQSHLDLMYTLMLHPKIICLTNNWVWNCPFYGRIIRFAEYYPISNGIEESMETLKSAIDRGYSILIFPEGTRSEDGRILRFHQGAFHLADKFNIDIVPIIIHGINHVFPKKEFLLRKGRIDVRIMPSITPQHELWKELEPRKTAQAIRKYYQKEYAEMCKEIETPNYYKDLVYHNYIYKGAKLAREVKKSLFSPELDAWIKQLPEKGEITIDNCGWGEKTLLAALVKKELIITAHEQDEDKLSVARSCASIPPNLKYE